MNSLNRLIELFGKFPGIGPRQARRFVHFLLSQNGSYIEEFVSLLRSLKREVARCPSCERFFSGKHTPEAPCPLCANIHRNRSLLMVVEKDIDADIVEKSGTYDGLYFILGGTVPILEKNPEMRIRVKELEKIIGERVKKTDGVNALTELILALSATPDGEHTAGYLLSRLAPLTEANGFKVTMLGRGLSTGTELEYSDSETIKNAFKNRA